VYAKHARGREGREFATFSGYLDSLKEERKNGSAASTCQEETVPFFGTGEIIQPTP